MSLVQGLLGKAAGIKDKAAAAAGGLAGGNLQVGGAATLGSVQRTGLASLCLLVTSSGKVRRVTHLDSPHRYRTNDICSSFVQSAGQARRKAFVVVYNLLE